MGIEALAWGHRIIIDYSKYRKTHMLRVIIVAE